MALVIVIAIAVQVIVIAIFTRRLQRAKAGTTVKSGQHSSVCADSKTTGLELSVSSGKNHV